MPSTAPRGDGADPMVEIDLILLEDLIRHRNYETPWTAIGAQIAALSAVLLLVLGMLLHSIVRTQAIVATTAPKAIHILGFRAFMEPSGDKVRGVNPNGSR